MSILEKRRGLGAINGLSLGIATALLARFEYPLIGMIHRLGQDAYIAELRRQLSVKLNRDVSFGQLSKSLKQLTKQGFLTVEDVKPLVAKAGSRSRRVYSLTSSGLATLERSIAAYEAANKIVAPENIKVDVAC